MIKTDTQLKHTLKSLQDFERELEEVKKLGNLVQRKLEMSNYFGMIASPRLEGDNSNYGVKFRFKCSSMIVIGGSESDRMPVLIKSARTP